MPIERITIPDDDMPGWIKTLREGGFTDKEIDDILGHLNATYAGIKRESYISSEIAKMDAEIAQRRGHGLSEAEKDALRIGIESRFQTRP